MTVKINKSPSKVHLKGNGDSSVQALKEENSRLKTDISRLRIEKARLKEANSQLKAEISQLRHDNSRLTEDLSFIREELIEEREISEHQEIEFARGNALYYMLQEEYLRAECT
jgi:predicted  nucleic acid-binding Zn-ribbon protein